jgi:hypothetical protein
MLKQAVKSTLKINLKNTSEENMKKQILSMFIAMAIIFTLIPVMPVIASEQSGYGSNGRFLAAIDSIVPNDAIHIKIATELAAIGGAQSDGKYYVLNNNILLTNEWIPINDFRGTLDGRGYVISNLFVLEDSRRANSGLFGDLTHPVIIKNIGVEIGNNGLTGTGNLGGLVGRSRGDVKIINSYVRGNIESNLHLGGGTFSCGGLLGRADAPLGSESEIEIINSYFEGFITIEVGDLMVGGLIGYVNFRTFIYISNSYAKGFINTAAREYNCMVGGLIGWIYGVVNVYNTNAFIKITDSSTLRYSREPFIGGLIGYLSNGGITFNSFCKYIAGYDVIGHIVNNWLINSFVIGIENTYPVEIDINIDDILPIPVIDKIVFATSTMYHQDIAIMCAELSAAAYSETDITTSLFNMGFNSGNIKTHNYFENPNEPEYRLNNTAHTFATKQVNNTTIVAIIIRGTDGGFFNGSDWLSNLNAGYNILTGKHIGFNIATERVYENLLAFINLNELPKDGSTKYLITGHSRGGAVANLLAVKLSELGVSNSDVFNYNFANPDVAIGLNIGNKWNPSGIHNNIFNICNSADLVPHVPGEIGNISTPPGFSWGKFGRTTWFNTLGEGIIDAHNMIYYIDYVTNIPFPNFVTNQRSPSEINLTRFNVKKNFVNHGMVADVCFHDKLDGNPHVHIMLTIRPMKEDGEWDDKQRKEYLLDSNGEKIYDKKKRQYKCRSIATTDWNEQGKAEEWRQAWADEVNAFLLQKNIDTRIDHRSYKRQGVEKIPSIHMGAAASEMERSGIRTEKGNLNREIREENNLIAILKNTIHNIKSSVADLFSRKAEITKLIAEERKPKGENLIQKLIRFNDNGFEFAKSSAPYLRNLKNVKSLKNVATAVAFLQTNNISTAEELQTALQTCKQAHSNLKSSNENKRTRISELDTLLENYRVYKEYKPILTEYESIKSERKQNKFANLHFEEIKQCKSARKKLPEKLTSKAWRSEREQLENECAVNNQKRMRLEDGIAQMETIGRNMESLDRYEKKQERERSKSMDIGL